MRGRFVRLIERSCALMRENKSQSSNTKLATNIVGVLVCLAHKKREWHKAQLSKRVALTVRGQLLKKADTTTHLLSADRLRTERDREDGSVSNKDTPKKKSKKGLRHHIRPCFELHGAVGVDVEGGRAK